MILIPLYSLTNKPATSPNKEVKLQLVILLDTFNCHIETEATATPTLKVNLLEVCGYIDSYILLPMFYGLLVRYIDAYQH